MINETQVRETIEHLRKIYGRRNISLEAVEMALVIEDYPVGALAVAIRILSE